MFPLLVVVFFSVYIAETITALRIRWDPGGISSLFLLMDAKRLDSNVPSAV